jgi:type 1 glutamine amidotransferase
MRLSADQWVVYDGFDGPGNGKHIVLISGDEEYRSEESLPQLGKILARHHGFKCTVLFAINGRTGEIDPEIRDNITGLEALQSADLMIISTRFRNLPDGQMKCIDDYLKSGRPVIGMRTATHAFQVPRDRTYHHYTDNYDGEQSAWQGGFGRLVLGEKWISHHGRHGDESTGGIIAPSAANHPILRGIEDRDIWGATDVYGVRLPLPGDSKPLVLGAILEGMEPDDHVVQGERNDPMMPVAWTKTYQLPGGQQGRVFATTMGASQDLIAAGTRRMLVNAVYWCLNMEEQIPEKSKVDLVGSYKPTPFGFGDHVRGIHPADHKMR